MPYTHVDGTTYRIADAHAHIYKEKIARKASAAVSNFYENVEMSVSNAVSDELLRKGEHVGCERFVVCSVATTPQQIESINTFIADMCSRHPEFVGLGAAHPDCDKLECLLDQVEELGLAGIKLHPDFQKFHIDDKRMMPLYSLAAQRGVRILFHVGDERHDYSAPEGLARVLDAVPDLKCQAAHFGCCRIWRKRPLALEGADIVFDTSSTLAWATQEEALDLIDRLGWEKLMWGSDFPMWDHAEELERFFALGLSQQQNQAILYDNFARFYNLG